MSLSSAAYIFNKNKLLLLLRDDIPTIPDPNTWDTPGGSVENGETFEKCLIRELEEELELLIEKDRLVFLWESITSNGIVEHSFLIKISDLERDSLVLHEGQEMRFFAFKEMLNLKMTAHLTKIYNEKNQEIKNLFFQ